MADTTGWFGLSDHVLHFLRVVGADVDEEGKTEVAGMIAVGLGGQEMVIGHDAVYFLDGQPRSLAGGLNGTSYGLRGVTVI